MLREELFRLDGTVPRDVAIDAWLAQQDNQLRALAREWFGVMRACGDEVRERMHDGCPTACLGDVAFGYVGVFKAHVSVGFFQGAALADPAGLLQGTGKFIRHVKLKRGEVVDKPALQILIANAYADVKPASSTAESLRLTSLSGGNLA